MATKFCGENGLQQLITNIKAALATKANSSHNHSASDINSGTLPVTRGGTGQTSLNSTVANALINALSTGSDVPQGADYYVSQYANGGSSTTSFHRRPISKIWDYAKTQGACYGANNVSYQIVVDTKAPTSAAENVITLVK